MPKKVLVINSSPRKNGNTAALAAAFAKAAQQKGHTVQTIELCRLDMRPCLGCYLCREGKGDPCVQKDEMNTVYHALNTCDLVVLCAPLYWWHFNAEMTIFIDRLCALSCSGGIPPLGCMMIVAAGDTKEDNFDEIISYYQNRLVKKFNWRDKGTLLADGIDMPGDVDGTDYLRQAARLANNI